MTRTLLLPVCLLLAAGCSSSSDPKRGEVEVTRADELREVGGLVAAHTAKGRKVAPTPAELSGYEQAFPMGVKALRAGEVAGVWGATMAGEGEVAAGGGGTAVVAFEKKAESAGGWVILQNGTVKQMTADEFKAAKK